MNIAFLRTLALRNRDLTQKAFHNARYKDANFYEARDCAVQLAAAMEVYCDELKQMMIAKRQQKAEANDQ
jgi:hypothetical protein